jgi:hypothetical protein
LIESGQILSFLIDLSTDSAMAYNDRAIEVYASLDAEALFACGQANSTNIHHGGQHERIEFVEPL